MLLEGEIGVKVGGSELGGDEHGGAGTAYRDVQGGEVGGDGVGANGGDHSRLHLLEEPLNGFVV